jgi:hypothetical protein
MPDGDFDRMNRQLAAARRIKSGLHAEADRAAGIDTRHRRPLVDGLPALQAQFAVRHDLPMRVVSDMLDEVVPLLDLLAQLRAIIDGAQAGPAIAWLNAFADLRDTIYPDTEVARLCRPARERREDRYPVTVAPASAATAAAQLHRCAHPDCPGLPYRASDLAHPCGRKTHTELELERELRLQREAKREDAEFYDRIDAAEARDDDDAPDVDDDD